MAVDVQHAVEDDVAELNVMNLGAEQPRDHQQRAQGRDTVAEPGPRLEFFPAAGTF